MSHYANRIAMVIVCALAVQVSARPTTPTPISSHTAFGNVSFTPMPFGQGQINAAGNGFTVTRTGLGLYTITFNTPFVQTPRLVIDPVQTSIGLSTHDQDNNSVNDWEIVTNGGTDAFQTRCRIVSQSPAGFSIDCCTLDVLSEICSQYTDVFGHVVTICTFTHLNHADIPFSFAAFSQCTADIVADQAVNVNDLLAVIAAWGPCAQPNNCPADIAPSTTGGDDSVNVNDLLAVIGSWGPCQ